MVFPHPKEGKVLVKRVVGLGGETIGIGEDSGDVFADGRLLVKPDDVREAVRERLDVPDPDSPGAPGAWTSATPPCGRRRYARDLFADEPRYEDEHGVREPQASPRPLAHDVYLSADVVSVPGVSNGLFLEWVDAAGNPANRIRGVAVTVSENEVAAGTYSTEACDEWTTRALRGGGVPAGRWTRLEVSLVDGVMRARAGATSARAEVEAPRGRARVVVGGGVRGLEVWRDVHYTRPMDAQFAVHQASLVQEGTLFCLGDHSSNSHDSRFADVGPIPVSSLIGPVVYRVWPPSRIGPVH